MERVDRAKEIAIGTVTVFQGWFAISIGGGEMTSAKQV